MAHCNGRVRSQARIALRAEFDWDRGVEPVQADTSWRIVRAGVRESVYHGVEPIGVQVHLRCRPAGRRPFSDAPALRWRTKIAVKVENSSRVFRCREPCRSSEAAIGFAAAARCRAWYLPQSSARSRIGGALRKDQPEPRTVIAIRLFRTRQPPSGVRVVRVAVVVAAPMALFRQPAPGRDWG